MARPLFMKYLLLLFLVGCAMQAGNRLIWVHNQYTDLPSGNYLMNCVWEQVDWETKFGKLYLNCEETKID